MSTNLEIESKSMLTKEEYEKLIKTFSDVKTYKQTNYYISSSELTKKLNGYGMRIRKKNHKFELTLKVTEKIGKTEINQEITRKSYVNLHYFHKFPSGEIANFLSENNVCSIPDLKIIGKLTTLRTDIKFNGSLISIDKSKYNHITDYEIECEDSTIEGSINNLIQFLDQNKIVYKKSEHTKLARFLQSRN